MNGPQIFVLMALSNFLLFILGRYTMRERFQKEAIANNKAHYFDGFHGPEFRWNKDE